MEPTQTDITWCLANRDLVMRWLERRGGWQEWDCAHTQAGDVGIVVKVRRDGGIDLHIYGRPSGYCEAAWRAELTWIPGESDVLEMLKREKVRPLLNTNLAWVWRAEGFVEGSKAVFADYDTGYRLATPTIALMELLKTLEGENE